ncbi:hypothetical protein PybrP1_002976 [[Pythium] brassicae (nom. inval.)]|nr:hypothetical protein PybrP1_002976 [[Pythium] brassicae (nom. inval.)]
MSAAATTPVRSSSRLTATLSAKKSATSSPKACQRKICASAPRRSDRLMITALKRSLNESASVAATTSPAAAAMPQQRPSTASPPPPSGHTCGLTLSPVKHASQEILESIKHQCDCAPVSMGEYVQSPRVAAGGAGVETQWLLHDKRAAAPGSDALDVEVAELGKLADERHATATVVGSMFTLTNTILGSGTLAVPFAIASSGWLLGNVVMLAIALITRYSVHLLLTASDRAGYHCAKTYESLGHYTMGAFGTKLAEFTFIFGGFGTLLRSRSLARMDRAVAGAIAIAFVLYEVIGLAGYLQFGAATQDNILLNFSDAYVAAHPALRLPLLLGRSCMGLALLLTAPIAMWPFRSCVLSVYLRVKNGGVQTPSSAATHREHALVTLVSQLLILLCSVFVPSVKIPLSIVGSVSGSLLIFIMPALFFMLLSPHATEDKDPRSIK